MVAAWWSRSGQRSSLPRRWEGGGALIVDFYPRVRLASAEGMCRRKAARHFAILRLSVRKTLSFSAPPGYRRRDEISRPELDSGQSRRAAQAAPQKRFFERLTDEHSVAGGHGIMKDYVREHRRRGRNMEFATSSAGPMTRISSPSTFRRTTHTTSGPLRRRSPRFEWTATPTPSGFSGVCRSGARQRETPAVHLGQLPRSACRGPREGRAAVLRSWRAGSTAGHECGHSPTRQRARVTAACAATAGQSRRPFAAPAAPSAGR